MCCNVWNGSLCEFVRETKLLRPSAARFCVLFVVEANKGVYPFGCEREDLRSDPRHHHPNSKTRLELEFEFGHVVSKADGRRHLACSVQCAPKDSGRRKCPMIRDCTSTRLHVVSKADGGRHLVWSVECAVSTMHRRIRGGGHRLHGNQ
jgi:hypothetical protein